MSRAEAEAKAAVQHPMGRNATCEEAAAPVLFLASKQAAFITGTGASVEGLQTALSSVPPTDCVIHVLALASGAKAGSTQIATVCRGKPSCGWRRFADQLVQLRRTDLAKGRNAEEHSSLEADSRAQRF